MGNDQWSAVAVFHIPLPRLRSVPSTLGVVCVRSGRLGAGRLIGQWYYDRTVAGSFSLAIQAATLWARQNALEVYLDGEADPTTKV